MDSTSRRRGPKLKKIHKDEAEGEVNATNSADANQAIRVSAPAEDLPGEMFYQIFQNLGEKSLKNSREVCTTWRNAIDNNSKLMKTLTIKIVDIKEFMNSQLASKAKSIRFIQPLKGTAKSLEDFFKKIGPTVEEVFFTFVQPQSIRGINLESIRSRQKLMFSMMLRFCTKLKRLTITSEDMNYDYIKDCTEDARNILGFSSIQSLSVIVKTAYMEDLRKFVLSLPNLRRLYLDCEHMDDPLGKFDNDSDDTRQQIAQKIFPNLILDNLAKYNGNLQEVWLEEPDDLNGTNLMKLLLSVGQTYPNTEIKCSRPDLVNLLRFKQSNDSNIQINKNSCRAIHTGLLEVCDAIIDQNLETSRIGLCSNLSTLDIQIVDPIPLVNFQFISELKKLYYLRIFDWRCGYPYSEEEDRYLRDIFSVGVPSVKTLELDSDCSRFGVNSLSFHLCFPNLTKLYIRNYYGNLSADFIYNLTNLNQLRSLTLEHLRNLTDEHLFRVFAFAGEDGKISNLPAVAGFQSLRSLHITICTKLTDNCLINGLAVCNKLEKIKLCYVRRGGERQGKFTNTGLNFLQQARNFSVEDQDESGSHVEYHVENSITLGSGDVYKCFRIKK